ncbi:uncharacterized protein BDV17DRAFT_292150 [Aspergillus undulatus]|uniref:uncharacterized protein n=1 Tax=Aspergillus undulatus TaxID=1810928 RepID=UPI003CCDF59A
MTESQLTPSSQHKLHDRSKQSLAKQRGTTRSWTEPSTKNTVPVFAKAKERNLNPQIPDPRLFDLSSGQGNPIVQLPTVAQCAVHLELLATFYQIRRKVLNSTSFDTVLGIVPKPRKVYRKKYQGRRWTTYPVNVKDVTFETRRLEKWPFYLVLAVTRFLKWVWAVEKLEEPSTSLDAAIMLPPIDVLMVWHTLLLNPNLLQSIMFKRLPNLPFPWAQIHESVDRDKPTWQYNLPETSSSTFQMETSLSPDLFSYLTDRKHSQKLSWMLKKQLDIGTPGKTPPKSLNAAEINRRLGETDTLFPGEADFLRNASMALDEKTSTLVFKLVDAIQRQASFVEKMEAHLWIRSPALEGTLSRAVERYSKFLKLFKLYPGTMLVPTLDIDLVWHTHQCWHSRYNEAMMQIAGRLVDHDDKLGKSTLDPGFERTANLFRVRYGVEYSRCLCWDCEALLSAIEGARGEGKEGKGKEIAKEVHESVAYYRAVETARRKGEVLLPVRDQDGDELAHLVR